MVRFLSCCLFSVLLLFHLIAATVPLLLPHRAGLVFASHRVIVPVDYPLYENRLHILKQNLYPGIMRLRAMQISKTRQS